MTGVLTGTPGDWQDMSQNSIGGDWVGGLQAGDCGATPQPEPEGQEGGSRECPARPGSGLLALGLAHAPGLPNLSVLIG